MMERRDGELKKKQTAEREREMDGRKQMRLEQKREECSRASGSNGAEKI